MTKDEAIEAMKNGERVIHRFFTNDEFIYMKKGDTSIYCEQDYKMNFGLFWQFRQGCKWETDWSIKK